MTSTTRHNRSLFTPVSGWPRPGAVRFVDPGIRRCFTLDGEGEPGSPAFTAGVGALYTAAYTLRFALKRAGIETRVGPLEGLWTAMPGQPAGSDAWGWTLLIAIPPEASREAIDGALADARRRRPDAHVEHVRIREFDEGPVVEALHVGPYATEPATIARMSAVAEAAGLHPSGPHHEIYLGDPRRSAPERLRTVIRQPVEALTASL
jgi:hypothetical protein